MDGMPQLFERIPVPPSRSWHTWVLSDHYERDVSPRGRHRTYLGELVYRSKYGADRGALSELLTATRHCLLQLREIPPQIDGLRAVTIVAAVPCNPPKALSLPHEIAAAAALALGVPDVSAHLAKTRPTSAAKLNPQLHSDAYEVRLRLSGQTVLLVDDLYHTGATLESVAAKVRTAGAAHVVGMCVTKVHRGMTP